MSVRVVLPLAFFTLRPHTVPSSRVSDSSEAASTVRPSRVSVQVVRSPVSTPSTSLPSGDEAVNTAAREAGMAAMHATAAAIERRILLRMVFGLVRVSVFKRCFYKFTT